MNDFHYERRGRDHDVLVVAISGWLDAQRCDYLFACIEHLIDDGVTKLVLDCGGVHGISSVGLGMLVRVHARMKRGGGEVDLAGVTTSIAKVLSLVHLDRVFHIHESVDEAIAAQGG